MREEGDDEIFHDYRYLQCVLYIYLDGTTSFTHNHPFFSVSIAHEYRGVIVLGVVYGVVLDEMYVARKGQGAKCNGKPISVTKTDKLINSLMATGFPTFRAEIKNDRIGNNMAYFEELL
jgi:myo-inositol-1(or 4)-monophosphatase